MSRQCKVVAYAGYRGEQEPRAVVDDGERLEVEDVHRRWSEPDGRFFEVRLAGGRLVVLRLGADDESWSIVREP